MCLPEFSENTPVSLVQSLAKIPEVQEGLSKGFKDIKLGANALNASVKKRGDLLPWLGRTEV